MILLAIDWRSPDIDDAGTTPCHFKPCALRACLCDTAELVAVSFLIPGSSGVAGIAD